MKSKRRVRTMYIVYSAVIAAVYAALTLALQPISFGIMQVRLSEAMSVLPYFTSTAIPGLSIGCLIANLLGSASLLDVIVGSAATLFSAMAARFIRNKWLTPLPSVLINAVMVGASLYFIFEKTYSLPVCMLSVGVGQLIACYGAGVPLMLLLQKFKNRLFPQELA